jgi:hypothetical protein
MSGKGKYGFVRYANRSIATFNPGGTLPGSTMVTGINDEGTILGVYLTADSIPPCALFCATWRERSSPSMSPVVSGPSLSPSMLRAKSLGFTGSLTT